MEIELINKLLIEFHRPTLLHLRLKSGVNEKKIIRFIKEGKIHSEKMNVSYPCEFCGKKISKGRACMKCLKKLTEELHFARERSKKQSSRLYK
jgi:hypothetical protein